MSDATTPCRVCYRDDSNDSPSTALTSSSEQPLHEPSIPENCKRRVDLATAGEGLSGKRCLIENTDEANTVHYAHCLPRETKEHILDALEFSWGMDRQTLNPDTRYNVFRLGSKFHVLYHKKSPMWLLLPEVHIIQLYYDARNDRNKFPDINETTYKYNFLASDEMVSVPIHRLTPPDNLAAAPPAAAYTYFAHPYATMDPITSHAHPRFVICNAGRKMEESGTSLLAFCRLYRNHARALEMVAAIWVAWTSVQDNPDFITFRQKPYTGDNMSSTSEHTAPRRLSQPIKKRRGDHSESPPRASKRLKEGQGENDGMNIRLDGEHDRKFSSKALRKHKKASISHWTKVVSETGGAVERATDLDMVTDEAQ